LRALGLGRRPLVAPAGATSPHAIQVRAVVAGTAQIAPPHPPQMRLLARRVIGFHDVLCPPAGSGPPGTYTLRRASVACWRSSRPSASAVAGASNRLVPISPPSSRTANSTLAGVVALGAVTSTSTIAILRPPPPRAASSRSVLARACESKRFPCCTGLDARHTENTPPLAPAPPARPPPPPLAPLAGACPRDASCKTSAPPSRCAPSCRGAPQCPGGSDETFHRLSGSGCAPRMTARSATEALTFYKTH